MCVPVCVRIYVYAYSYVYEYINESSRGALVSNVVLQTIKIELYCIVCLFGFYGISAFVGYLMPNLFLYK